MGRGDLRLGHFHHQSLPDSIQILPNLVMKNASKPLLIPNAVRAAPVHVGQDRQRPRVVVVVRLLKIRAPAHIEGMRVAVGQGEGDGIQAWRRLMASRRGDSSTAVRGA